MAVDLTKIYQIDEEKGIVKHTVKAYGNYFTGTAKTNFEAGDTFDIEKGKRIAKLRAVQKMKKALLKDALSDLEFVRELASTEDAIVEYIQKMTESLIYIQNKLDIEVGADIDIKEEEVTFE
jgi:hypothetical protein